MPDGDGTLLDNTLVIYGSPMGNPNVHNHKRCPLFFAGHAGGALKGGLHIKAADGTPMANAFLDAAAQAGHGRRAVVRRQHRRARPERRARTPRRRPSRRSRTCVRRLIGGLFAGAIGALCLSAASAARPTARCADAAMTRRRAAVRTLLKQGADVNAAQGDGVTGAALGGAPGRRGAGEHAGRRRRQRRARRRASAPITPLHLAAERGSGADRRGCSCKAGADVDATHEHRRDAADVRRRVRRHRGDHGAARRRRRGQRQGDAIATRRR